MPAGRPRAFATVEDLQQGIDAYIAEALVTDDPISVSGLAAHLEVNRDTIFAYAKGDNGDEFSDPLKKVVQKIEAQHVTGLLKGQLNPTGCIFTLKNNHGWKDEKHIKEESTQTHSVDKETLEQAVDAAAKRLEAAHAERHHQRDT